MKVLLTSILCLIAFQGQAQDDSGRINFSRSEKQCFNQLAEKKLNFLDEQSNSLLNRKYRYRKWNEYKTGVFTKMVGVLGAKDNKVVSLEIKSNNDRLIGQKWVLANAVQKLYKRDVLTVLEYIETNTQERYEVILANVKLKREIKKDVFVERSFELLECSLPARKYEHISEFFKDDTYKAEDNFWIKKNDEIVFSHGEFCLTVPPVNLSEVRHCEKNNTKGEFRTQIGLSRIPEKGFYESSEAKSIFKALPN